MRTTPSADKKNESYESQPLTPPLGRLVVDAVPVTAAAANPDLFPPLTSAVERKIYIVGKGFRETVLLVKITNMTIIRFFVPSMMFASRESAFSARAEARFIVPRPVCSEVSLNFDDNFRINEPYEGVNQRAPPVLAFVNLPFIKKKA
jgi:hypothetical protein